MHHHPSKHANVFCVFWVTILDTFPVFWVTIFTQTKAFFGKSRDWPSYAWAYILSRSDVIRHIGKNFGQFDKRLCVISGSGSHPTSCLRHDLTPMLPTNFLVSNQFISRGGEVFSGKKISLQFWPMRVFHVKKCTSDPKELPPWIWNGHCLSKKKWAKAVWMFFSHAKQTCPDIGESQ